MFFLFLLSSIGIELFILIWLSVFYGAISILFIVLPFAILIAILVIVDIYLARQNEETDYKKKMKKLRKITG